MADDSQAQWILSFCDASLPEGTQYLGGAVVEADDLAGAITRAWSVGCNPGGEVEVAGPLPPRCIPAAWHDRLLTRDEVLSIPEPS